MNAVYLASALILLFMAGAAQGGEGDTWRFEGTVFRGEDFHHELPEGLEFRLEFIGYGPEGWSVTILDPAHPGDNFCSVVTPPYRGVNALQIYARHFFSEDVTGPNDGTVNAPGEQRRFSFVTGKQSFDLAFELLSAMLWPDSPEDAEAAATRHDTIPRGSGVLTITDLQTGSIPGSDSVWIDSMEFQVELQLP